MCIVTQNSIKKNISDTRIREPVFTATFTIHNEQNNSIIAYTCLNFKEVTNVRHKRKNIMQVMHIKYILNA